MIERTFVSQNIKEFKIKEFLASELSRVGLSDVKLQRTPLGEKIVVSATRPGLVVGRAGSNIQRLTKELKEKFGLENPQIEIEEIKNGNLDPAIIAEQIAGTLERFGAGQFKSAGHKSMFNVMSAGALGVEILISGKIPSQRAKRWRFYQGYLKKCGDIALTGVNVAHATAHLKVGAVGIKVSIMPGSTLLPDRIEISDDLQTVVEEVSETADETDEVVSDDTKKSVDESKEVKSKSKKAKPKKDSAKKSSKVSSKVSKSKEDVKDDVKDDVKEKSVENVVESESESKSDAEKVVSDDLVESKDEKGND